MSKFTPGPWEAGNLDKDRFPCVFIGPHLRYLDNSGNGFRASITINEGPTSADVESGKGFGTTLETCRANAHLIAAAPELLEALMIVSACGLPAKVSMYDEEGIEGWRWIHPDGREWTEIGDWNEPPPAHPVVSAAIAKAKGE